MLLDVLIVDAQALFRRGSRFHAMVLLISLLIIWVLLVMLFSILIAKT